MSVKLPRVCWLSSLNMSEIEAQFHQNFGQRLANRREANGISQDALAVQLQCQQSMISRIESGERAASLTFLMSWSSAMNVPFAEIAGEALELWTA